VSNKKRILINGIETNYDVYDDGRVYSLKNKKFLSPRGKKDGYQHVSLYHDGKVYQLSIHRLVALYFIENPDNKPEVNHKNGNKTDNNVKNLEWVTTSENIIHAFKTGLKIPKRGKKSHLAQYDETAIKEACQYMEDGFLTLEEISKLTGISYPMIYLISTHQSWVDISKNYNIDNFYHDRKSYTTDQYAKVFDLLHENYLSLYEISDITKVKYAAISNILSHKSNPFYNDLYDKIDISGYTGGVKPYKEIPPELDKELKQLYKQNIKPKYIKRLLSKKFNINEERIRVYMRNH
jgi:hypothetical protein